MKTILCAAVVAAAVFAAPHAAADFHPGCDSAPRSASVALTASDGTFTFEGRVMCPGADSIAITSLVLTTATGSSSTAPPAACTGGCSSVSTSGQAPATAGLHELRMTFTVTSQGATYAPSRTARFVWVGASQPARLPG